MPGPYEETMISAALVWVHLGACALLALFGAHRLWLLADYARQRRRGTGDPSPADDGTAPPVVTVQLPLYNERAVAGRLIDAVAAFDYPRDRFEVQVLDDSDDETRAVVDEHAAAARARGVDVKVIRRADRVGFKAGALQLGLEQARGSLVAIFDADFVPRPDFLTRVVPSFADGRVGMVQARWGHLNRDESLLTRAQAAFLDAHFSVEHRVRDGGGRFFNFNGTAGVWRKHDIAQAGGWDAATLTEDLDLSFRAQLAGSRFSYLDSVEVPAELPEDVNAFKGQQHRWAKGSIQTARRLLAQVWRADLRFTVKLDATMKLLSNVAFALLFVVVLTMPGVAIARAMGATPLERFGDLGTLGVATLPVAAHFLVAQRARGRSLLGAIAVVPLALGLGAALSVNNARAVIEGLFGLGSNTFVRTPKRGDAGPSRYRVRLPPLVGVELCVGVAHLAVAAWLTWEGAGWTTPFLWLFGTSLTGLGLSSILGPVVARWRDRAPSRAPAPAA
jgi:hypothetical protein